MPIKCARTVRKLSQEQFHQVDKPVFRVACDVHNQLGRLLDEDLYKSEIAFRCREMGMTVDPEFKIQVTHHSFSKDYFVDLLIDDAVIEAKTQDQLAKSDDAQGLNYLYLTDTRHGSLINLRSPSVTRRFLSTTLTASERRRFRVLDRNWNPLTRAFDDVKGWMLSLLEDWGAFLEFTLYRKAITHFLGGPENVISKLPVFSGSRIVGHQKAYLLAEDIAFAITAARDGQKGVFEHYRRFLDHTSLLGIAWINLSGHDIEFTTISKQTK